MLDFAHLHVHSEYSSLDGASRIEDLVSRAQSLGMRAIALTDHGNLCGAIQMYRAARANNINPVLGIELYTCAGSHLNHSAPPGTRPTAPHLTLLAASRTGFMNLCKLSSITFSEGFYYKPRASRDLLARYSEGVIALSGCIASELSRSLLAGDTSAATATAEWFRSIYGDRYFLEVMASTEHQRQTLAPILDLSQKLGIPAVCTADAHYLTPDDSQVQDVMICLSTGSTLETQKLKSATPDYYLRSPADMYALVPDRPDIFRRTQEIADQVDIDLQLGKRHFPSFAIPSTPAAHLRDLCLSGLRDRYTEVTDVILSRLDRELAVIDKLGFSSYFLVIHDFMTAARSRNIRCSARGSAAGALTCYALRISDVCPLRYGLLFERFLDESRREPPDIDVDIERNRREEIIQYLRDKYGSESVAQIVTFSTFAARAAIKDVCRVLGVPHTTAQGLADCVSKLPGTTLDTAIADSPVLTEVAQKASGKIILDLARRLEGMVRNAGTHAAAIVIAPGQVNDFVPTMRSTGGAGTVTQWAMDDVEAAGLIKLDLLGLQTLDIISCTMRRVGISSIPDGDPDTWAMFERGHTEGVFQLSGYGMKKVLMQLRPKSIEEISHVIAIFRPGPIDSGMLDRYVARRQGRERVVYHHLLLEEVLGSTLGIAIYQEQLMNLAYRVAGIPLSDAYSLIKVISKKKKDKVKEYKDRFVAGALDRGLTLGDIEVLWDQIEAAGRYSFNLSHSTAYAWIAYQTAYLKTHYPSEFMSSVLTGEIPHRNHLAKYGDGVDTGIRDCRRMGIMVAKPDINVGRVDFHPVNKHTITYALNAIRGVGDAAAASIVQSRGRAPFRSFADFCRRIDYQAVTKTAVIGLLQAGAFDHIDDRTACIDKISDYLKDGRKFTMDRSRGQRLLFD